MPAQPVVDISIILPVFNVEPYLAACIESLLAQQGGQQLEIILVDDASTDKSGEICAGYAGRVANVHYHRLTDNAGVSVARNTGIDLATGRYIAFVDPDDRVPANAFVELLQHARDSGADVVKGNNQVCSERGDRAAGYDVEALRVLDGEQILEELFRHRYIRGHPWGKLFRREVIGDMRFPVNVRMAQDLQFIASVLARAERLLLIPVCVYEYQLRGDGSTGSKYRKGGYLHWLDSVEALGLHVRSDVQRRAYTGLQVRTLNQAVREIGKLSRQEARPLAVELRKRRKDWQLGWVRVLWQLDSIKTLWRYVVVRWHLARL